MERERFDGGDIAHLIRGSGRDLDWQRLLNRFGPHWRVLFSHLVMFGFCYPSEREDCADMGAGRTNESLAHRRSVAFAHRSASAKARC